MNELFNKGEQKDNLMDIIDIEETLSKNRFIPKVQHEQFIYEQYLNIYEKLEQNPEKAMMLAIKGMLPKNSLGRQMIKKVRIYTMHMKNCGIYNGKNLNFLTRYQKFFTKPIHIIRK